MHQIYRRTPMSKCGFYNFIEIVLWQVCSPVNLLQIFRTPFRNTSGGLHLNMNLNFYHTFLCDFFLINLCLFKLCIRFSVCSVIFLCNIFDWKKEIYAPPTTAKTFFLCFHYNQKTVSFDTTVGCVHYT